MITLYYCRVTGSGRNMEHRTAHALLNWAAGQRWPKVGPSPALIKGKNGKPGFAGFPDCHFNLSHAGGWAVCALSHRPVGIDLQESRGASPAARKFTAREQEWLREQGEEHFSALWVKKEAYLKCIGAGLTRRLDSFSVLPLGENQPEPGVYNRLIPFPEAGFSCALCGEDTPDPVWHFWKGEV